MLKKVLVSGCNGKMGQLVCSAVNATEDMEVICGFDKIASNTNFPIYSDISQITEIPDVIIDFSIPVATREIIKFAYEKSIPIVVATTRIV